MIRHLPVPYIANTHYTAPASAKSGDAGSKLSVDSVRRDFGENVDAEFEAATRHAPTHQRTDASTLQRLTRSPSRVLLAVMPDSPSAELVFVRKGKPFVTAPVLNAHDSASPRPLIADTHCIAPASAKSGDAGSKLSVDSVRRDFGRTSTPNSKLQRVTHRRINAPTNQRPNASTPQRITSQHLSIPKLTVSSKPPAVRFGYAGNRFQTVRSPRTYAPTA